MASKKDAASIIANASRHTNPPALQHSYAEDTARKAVWCETQWAHLSLQAKKLELPKLPYFDPETMLLSKEVNVKLWGQLGRLWDYLGPDRAPCAVPELLEGGEVKWHSFLSGDKGEEAQIYDHALDAFMSRVKKPGIYEG